MPFRFLLALAFLFISALQVQGLRFYVDGTPGGNGDDRRSVQSAQNPATPFRTISHALRVAHLIPQGRPHVIRLAPGTYAPSVNGETFPLVISQTGIYLETVGRVIFDAEGRSGFFRIAAPTRDFVVKGIDFYHARAERGGAVFCEGCSLRVVDNRFFDLQASEGGHVLYVRNGRVQFFNNIARDCGSRANPGAVLELHDSFADPSQRDVIRNNTFYENFSPNLLVAGNRTDIQNNIFMNPEQPTIIDLSQFDPPLVRYNLFWDAEILFLSARTDSIKVLRTVRDTLTLAEQGVVVPPVVTAPPPTLAKAGEPYQWLIPVRGNRPLFSFQKEALPAGADTQQLTQNGVISWTPTLADTGSHEINIMVRDPNGNPSYLYYKLLVFAPEHFPDTTAQGLPVSVSLVPDTSFAVAQLNALVPSFSSAASAGHNLYANPRLLAPEVNRFELLSDSPAIDSGNPIVALYDPRGSRLSANDGDRNNIGHSGGPPNAGPPLPDTAWVELNIATLPDSVAVEGQPFTYDPVLAPAQRVDLVDLIPGTGAPSMDPYRVFGKAPPITWTPTLADTGTYLIGVVVYTNRGQGRHYFPLRVRPANLPPSIISAPDTLALEDQVYQYTVQASDANGDTLRFSLVSGPRGMSIDPASGHLRWTPTQEEVGQVQVEIRVEDGRGGIASQRFALSVRNVNDPPQITSVPDSTVLEDRLYTYALTAIDPDPGDSLSYLLLRGPTGLSLDAAGVVRWIPTGAQVGVHQISLRVRDRSGSSVDQQFSLRVLPVDDPPQILSLPDTLALEDHLYQYAVRAVDEEGGSLTYALTAGPAGMQLDAAGVVRWTPTGAQIGVHAIALQVADPAGQTAEQRFDLRVVGVNDPPQITHFSPPGEGSPPRVVVLPGVPVLLRVEASDEDGDPLAFAWLLNGVLQTTVAGTSLEHLPHASAIDTVTVRVTDGIDTTAMTWIVDGRRLPHIEVAIDTVRFGAVVLGDTGRVALAIASTGNAPLNLSNLQVGDLRFAALLHSGVVSPGQTTTLELRFAPTDLQTIASVVAFATDDPDRPLVQIPLLGRGRAPTRLSIDLDPAAGPQDQREAEIAPGEEFSLAIYAEEAFALTAFEGWLIYDPEAVRWIRFVPRGASEANLLDQEGGEASAEAATLGDTLVAVRVVASGTGRGASGNGLLGLATWSTESNFAAQEQTAIRLERAFLHPQGGASPDTLWPELQVILRPYWLRGDFNGDGIVDFADFFLFADQFGKIEPRYDLDGSGGPVDFADFFLFADQFGKSRR